MNILNTLLDFIAPRFCSVCGKRLMQSEKVVCTNCLLDLNVSEYYNAAEGNTLERTMWQVLPIQRAAAFLTYERNSEQRNIVLDLKYHNQPRIGYHLGMLMASQLKEKGFFDSIDIIIPIPIPRNRKIYRGYNQSEQLAIGISKTIGLPINTKAIKRLPYETSQTHLTATERGENVKDTFMLRKNRAAALQNKHILLIDDVITTTATIRACGQILSDIPGIKISVLSLAVSKNLISNIRKSNPLLPDNAPRMVPDNAPKIGPDNAPEIGPDNASGIVPDDATEILPDNPMR